MKNLSLRIVLLVVICVILSGCVESAKRAFDPSYEKQMAKPEIDGMFPEIPNLSGWILNDFVSLTTQTTKTVYASDKMSYAMDRPRVNTDREFILVSTQLDFLTASSGGFGKYANLIKTEEELFLKFCEENGITVTRYKNGFSKEMFEYFGVYELTGCATPVGMNYKYTFIGYKNDLPVVAFSALPYVFHSKTTGRAAGFYIDTVFLTGKNIQSFLDTQFNSFIKDMESKVFE